MTNNIEDILLQVLQTFHHVAGIDAIVLGGSHATGTANKNSDIDIGIYYDETSFDLITFRHLAATLDDQHQNDIITEPGEWGPWINGGGWLTINGIAVDLLFRNTKKVISVIDACIDGKITIDYQCGHPFGFVNSIYMGELAYCKILCNNNNLILDQKKRLDPFPRSYQKAVIERFLWECEFSMQCGSKAISKGDVLYAAGSIFRCAISLLQVLYAINEMYMLNEKGCLQRLLQQKAAYLPINFAKDIKAALSDLNANTIADCFDRIKVQYHGLSKHHEHNFPVQ